MFAAPSLRMVRAALAALAAPLAFAAPGGLAPTIDLNAEKQRQVLVDREPGQYLGHTTSALLEDGKTILLVYPKGHGSGPIVCKRSTDGGLSWSDRLPTPASWATSKETPTIHRVTTPEGRKRLLLFSGRQKKFAGERIRLSISDDDGRTWSELKPIGDFGGVTAMSSLVPLRDGALMALFHDSGVYDADGTFRPKEETKGDKGYIYVVFKTLSSDGGLTWSAPEKVVAHPDARLCEPGALRSPDGRQIAVLLREQAKKFNSMVIFSDDEGKTWSAPREVAAGLTGARHVAVYAPDGRLFISFRDMAENSPSRGDWAAWIGTYDDIVHARAGQVRVRLLDSVKGGDCAYPGVEVLRDGTIVATTYGSWTANEPPYIMSVRLKLAEIDQRAREPGRLIRAPDAGGRSK
ncbi:MAG: sialidase family protein [Opitutaceae bacterium]|nr:sialidase family protein [Opitutaceae bacterium]